MCLTLVDWVPSKGDPFSLVALEEDSPTQRGGTLGHGEAVWYYIRHHKLEVPLLTRTRSVAAKAPTSRNDEWIVANGEWQSEGGTQERLL